MLNSFRQGEFIKVRHCSLPIQRIISGKVIYIPFNFVHLSAAHEFFVTYGETHNKDNGRIKILAIKDGIWMEHRKATSRLDC